MDEVAKYRSWAAAFEEDAELGDDTVPDLVEAAGYWHFAAEHEREHDALRRAHELDDGNFTLSGHGAYLGYLLIHGRADEAEPLLTELRRHGSPNWQCYAEVSHAYDAIGAQREALRWLNIAARDFLPDLDGQLDVDMGDPGYELLAERAELRSAMGLPEDLLDQTFHHLLERARAEIDEIKELAAEGSAGPAPKSPGRNEPCPCGSGLKYKKCHGKPASA